MQGIYDRNPPHLHAVSFSNHPVPKRVKSIALSLLFYMLGTIVFVFLVAGLAYFLRALTDRKLKYVYRGFLCLVSSGIFGLIIVKYFSSLLENFIYQISGN